MAKMKLIAEPGKHDITATRVLDAPRALVYRAYTEPALMRRWLGPRRITTPVCEVDVRPGGTWRWVQRDPEGNEYRFHGVYHAVEAPERLVDTFEFDGAPGHVSLEEATFTEHDGKTTVMIHSVFQSVADRDGALGSDMETGMSEGFERLDEVLREMKR